MRTEATEFIRKREAERLCWLREVHLWRMNQYALEAKRATDRARSEYEALQLKANQVIARERDERDELRLKWANSKEVNF